MRLNITLAREEHPELFAALEKVGKGAKRAQRLKTLASERLLLAEWCVNPKADLAMLAATTGAVPPASDAEMRAAHELFLPPIR